MTINHNSTHYSKWLHFKVDFCLLPSLQTYVVQTSIKTPVTPCKKIWNHQSFQRCYKSSAAIKTCFVFEYLTANQLQWKSWKKLSSCPVYEWRLFCGKNLIGEIHGQSCISWIHVRRDKSSSLEFWSVTFYTWHHTPVGSLELSEHGWTTWAYVFLTFPLWVSSSSLESSSVSTQLWEHTLSQMLQPQIRGFMHESDTKNFSNAIRKT